MSGFEYPDIINAFGAEQRKRPEFILDLNVLRRMISGILADLDAGIAMRRLWAFLDLADGLSLRVKDPKGELDQVFVAAAGDMAALAPRAPADIALAGGAESMSRANYWLPAARWGAKMGDQVVLDSLTGALSDPFDALHMGVTAENIAAKYGLTRAQQDEFSVESHRRAANAIQNGYFKSQILPIEIKDRKGTKLFDTDEHVRGDASLENLGKLKAAFKKDGSVTAGNASGINDGAAAVVLMERKLAEKKGLKPMARLVAYGHAGSTATPPGSFRAGTSSPSRPGRRPAPRGSRTRRTPPPRRSP